MTSFDARNAKITNQYLDDLILYRHSSQRIKTRSIPIKKRPNHIQITKPLKLRPGRKVKTRSGIKCH